MNAVTTPAIRPVPKSFFQRPTLDVARDLLGRCLYVIDRDRPVGGRIVETEAYIGEDDPACHAARGRTPKTETMYGPAGFAYVYFTYGHHWMLNVVTEPEDFPAAVLIRGLEPTEGISLMKRRRGPGRERILTNGPGKLTSALGITRRDNATDMRGPRIVITGKPNTTERVSTSGRIGVSVGGRRPWRFFIDGNPWVSPYRQGTRASRKNKNAETRN